MIDVEALRLALSKEEEAIRAYTDMIGRYPNLKDLLYMLLTEEQKHKHLIEKKISELTVF